MLARHRIARLVALASLLSVVLTAPAHASEQNGPAPDEGGEIESMGQPPRFMPYGGFAVGAYRPSSDDGAAVAASLHVGLFKPLTSPIAAIGIAGEGYVGARGSAVDGGVRLLGVLRPLGFGLGIDYSIAGNDPDLILSFTRSFWRGGLFGLGGMFRVNYLPTRDQTVTIGYQIPIGDTWMGRTRPRSDRVKLFEPVESPASPRPAEDAALADALARVRHAAEWQARCVAPFLDQRGDTREEVIDHLLERVRFFQEHTASKDAAYPTGHGCPEEIRVYHQELDRAFSLAASGGAVGRMPGESSQAGRRISAQAREILLDQVILPYNRELGRIKDPDTTRGFAARARESLLLWLNQSGAAPPSTHASVVWVYQQLLDQVEDDRRLRNEVWETSLLGWLPIRLAKRPEELETQAQFDALVERAVGQEFSRGNEHHYIVNEKFQWELLRHIRAAEDYHVLWIHDYRGRNGAGGSDRLGFDQVYHGYLKALTERVRAYDTTGKLPVYMIFLDQNFYEPNAGRLWMSFLEDPLHRRVDLPGGPDAEEQEGKIREAQAELREAVASSRLLQERRRSYGDDWLANRVKVHVNITNPVDWSFWSQQVIPVLGIPDVLMRDHRKISFYDVTEADPSRGEAIFTGMGIGEHYAGPTWEDRAILVQGPSLVGLKDAARQLVRSQGFAEDEVPYPLRPQPRPANYAELVAARQAAGIDYRAMQIHNQTGYLPKQINVYKALLYDAMPEGSILIVPDSLWNSPFWASMLLGNAVRGGRVYIISPALANAPSAGFPQMSRAQELYSQLLVVKQAMAADIARYGGSLNLGIYAVDKDVGDLHGRIALFYEKLMANPFILDFFDVPEGGPKRQRELEQRFERRTAEILAGLEAQGFKPGYVAEDVEKRKPKLHLKAQLVLSREAEEILKKLDWPPLMDAFLSQSMKQVHDRSGYVSAKEAWIANARLWEEQLDAITKTTTPEERARAIAYLSVGSHNMDYRGLMMDGEVLYVTASRGVLPGMLDLLILLGLSDWVEDAHQLDALLPPYKEWQREVGRFMKYAL
jgi:phosphatidylserine/phosphatidylglycerophosphate/cardiolipin synthase-like enzyme